MTEKMNQVKRRAQLVLMIALLALGKTASSQCESEFTYNEFPQGCGVFIGFAVNAFPTTDSVVFDYGNGETFTTNGISGEAFYTQGAYTVEVTAYHTNGCTSSSTQNITIDGLMVETDADTVACQMDLVLNAYVSGGSGNYLFSWSPTFGLDNPTSQNPTLSSNVLEEEYTVTVTDEVNGCEMSSSILVTRQSPLFDTLSLCDGAVTIDLGPGASSYYWQTYTDTAGNSSNLNYPITQQSILVDDPGDYFMYADFPQCGALTSLVTVETCEDACWNLFTYNLITGSCVGDSYSFVATGDGTITSYLWEFGDGSNSTSPNPVHAFPIGTFEITLTTVNADGCVATTSQFISNTIPSFTVVAFGDTTACQGSAYINAEIYGGSGDFEFEWTPQWGLDDPTSLSTFAEGVHEELYTIYVTDLNTNCVTVDSVIVSSYVAVFDTLELCNDSVYLNMGPGGTYYNWLPLYDDDFETQAIWTDNPGTHVVYAEYPGCGAITHVFEVEACSGGCTSSFVSSLDAPVCASWVDFVASTSSSADSIVFHFGDGTSFTTNDLSAEHFFMPGEYNVEMVTYHSNGCISEYSETLVLGNGLTADIFPDSTACGGNNNNMGVIVSGGSGNFEYQWYSSTSSFSNPNIENPIHYGITEATEIAVYVTDFASGCQVADTTWMFPNVALNETYELCGNSVLFDAPPYSSFYNWEFEDEQGNTTALTEDGPLMEATEPGTYTCFSYTSGCDPVEHTFIVAECSSGCFSDFTQVINPQCIDYSVEFYANPSSPTDSIIFYFSNGNEAFTTGISATANFLPGTYNVEMVAYHSDGCISESTHSITVNGSLLEVDILNDSVACAGDISLSANIFNGSGNYEYQWFFGGLPFTGDNLPNPTVSGITEVTEVAVYITDLATGCEVADTGFVYPNVMLIETIELCGNSVLFDAPPFSQTYSWTFEDPQGTITPLTEDGPLMEATEIGTYICVTYTSGCNIVDHIFYVVECSSGCFNEFAVSVDSPNCGGSWVNFTANPSSTTDSLIFYFSNGNEFWTNGISAEVFFEPGTYTAELVAYHTDGCISESSQQFTIGGSLVVELFENIVACNGTLGLSVDVEGGSGTYEFQWEPASLINAPTDQYTSMTVAEDTWVTILVEDSLGCSGTDSMYVYANEAINEVIELCDNSTTLTVPPGSLLYNWSYTDEFGNTTQLPNDGNSIETDNLGVFSCVTYYSGCNEVIHLFTVVECANGGDVWPGDANNDLIVTNADALWVGLGYSQTGPVRPNANNSWIGQPADDWIFNFSQNNVNLKHADCDGNGIINFDDTLAISLNYGLTHNKVDAELLGGEPEIWVEAMPDTAGLEEAIDIYIHMGKSDVMVDSIYGISFTINWDENFTMPNIASLDYANSVFGTPGDDLLTFEKAFLNEGRIDIALSRINALNIDGYGELVHLRIVTIDNLSGYGSIPISVENVTAITASESDVTFSLIPDTVYIDPTRTDVLELNNGSQDLEVFPNPTTGRITVINGDDRATFQVMDARGRTVFSGNANGNSRFEIDLSGMESGMYHLQVVSENSTRYSKIKLVR